MNILVQPNEFMAGYSAIPIRVSDVDATNFEQFKYLINLLWDKVSFSSVTDAFINDKVNTVITCSTPHNFRRGDVVFINDFDNNDTHTGYYNITSVINTTQIAIDILFEQPFGSNPALISRVIKYKLSPDLEAEAKIDLSNTIKDFVTEDLEDVNAIFEGPNTSFYYDISIGREAKLLWPFDDNFFVSGNIGFITTGQTINDVPFNIGDEIFIQQNIEAFDYFDNFFSSGNIGFTSLTQTHNFVVGNTIQVVGQITNPQYNGFTVVTGVPNTSSLVTELSFGFNTPPEGGTIYGFSRPEYNGVATITDIITGTSGIGNGVVIVTDKPFTNNTSPIGGTIRYSDNRISVNHNRVLLKPKVAYNTSVNRLDYTVNYFDKYVIQNRSASLNNISTILGNTDKYRIERTTKSWLLAHVDPDNSMTGYTNGAVYEFYDSGNNLLTRQGIANTTTNYADFYFPVGYDQILNSPNLINYLTPLSAITFSNIEYYTVSPAANQLARTNKIKFYINNDCSQYEVYHLMWKDRQGSWLSYPFIYISKDNTEVERKNFYQTEGNWDNNTFGYDTYGRGEKTYFGRSRDKVLLNSGWVDEYENLLMKDLMQSTSVFIQTPDNVLIGCLIEENQIELRKQNSDKIFNYTFNVRIGNNEYRF